jgi:hypothetical protein
LGENFDKIAQLVLHFARIVHSLRNFSFDQFTESPSQPMESYFYRSLAKSELPGCVRQRKRRYIT